MPRIMGFDRYAGKKLLEVGCGMGTDLLQFARGGAICTGVDLTPRSIEISRRRFELYGMPGDFLLTDGERLPFPDESFDVVTSTLVLHHVAPDDRAAAVGEMRRVLRPGGQVLIAEFDGVGRGGLTPLARLHTRHPEHAGSLDAAIDLLTGSGFTAVTRGSTTISGIGQVVARRAEQTT